LQEDKPQGYEECKYSKGWAQNWFDRHEISSRTPTNTKEQDDAIRIPKVKRFHSFVRHIRMKPPLRDPKYGRFPANCTFAGIAMLCLLHFSFRT
jgi:hypothetical protein